MIIADKDLATNNIRLTTAEVASLWGAYLGNTMSVCVLGYFYRYVEDQDIKEVLKYALELAEKNVLIVTGIFQKDNFPLPVGFTGGDVNFDAPRLYSDTFFLNYLHQTTRSGFSLYAVSLPSTARSDVREFMSNCIVSLTDLYKRVADVSLSKGLFTRPPYAIIPNDAEFVETKGFLAGFFGDKRPINMLEIMHIDSNIQTNALGKSLIIGFSQVAQSEEIREYFLEGKARSAWGAG